MRLGKNSTSFVKFIAQFKKRGGLEVVFSGFGCKLISLFISIYVARLLSPENYGLISYALMIMLTLVPVSGVGMDFVLLRYGSVTRFKKHLFNDTLKYGLFYSFILVIFVICLSPVISTKHPDSPKYIQYLSIILIFDFILRMVQNLYRITDNNKVFAIVDITRSLVLLFLTITLVYFYDAHGYIFALLLSPLIVCLLFFKKSYLRFRPVHKSHEFCFKSLHKYGFFISVGSVLSQLQIPLAGILIGQITNNVEDVASYKVASIIPMSLLFIPNLFFKSEFVHLSKNNKDKKIIKEYTINYLKLAVPVSLFICIFSFLFSASFIPLIFSEKYQNVVLTYNILCVGVCGGFVFRQLFGNLTFAAGRPDINVAISILALLISVILISNFVNLYGVDGAAIGTAIMFWFTGLINLIAFYYFIYRRL